MATKEIIENNKLIAEFMGVNEVESFYESYHTKIPIWYTRIGLYDSPAFSSPNLSFPDFLEHSKYHQSWDWLMPVVEMIESLEFRCEIGKHSIYIYPTNSYDDIINVDVDRHSNKLESLYEAVLRFIKWYNSQPK